MRASSHESKSHTSYTKFESLSLIHTSDNPSPSFAIASKIVLSSDSLAAWMEDIHVAGESARKCKKVSTKTSCLPLQPHYKS